jgi:hypothetical protein
MDCAIFSTSMNERPDTRRARLEAELAELRAEGERLQAESSAISEAINANHEQYWRAVVASLVALREEVITGLDNQTDDQTAHAALSRLDAMIEVAQVDLGPGEATSHRRAAHRRVTGIDAVRALLQEEPDREWRPREVHQILRDRGWISGAKSGAAITESALNRLWRRTDEVERTRPGRYRWKVPSPGA